MAVSFCGSTSTAASMSSTSTLPATGGNIHRCACRSARCTAMIGRGLASRLHRRRRPPPLRPQRVAAPGVPPRPGLRVIDVAHSMQLLDRLPDAPFADYDLTEDDVLQVRDALQAWPRDHEQDQAGRSPHAQAHAQQDTSPTASLAADGLPSPLQGAEGGTSRSRDGVRVTQPGPHAGADGQQRHLSARHVTLPLPHSQDRAPGHLGPPRRPSAPRST
jgi:hypothetical protein